jgi:hypothetical protein
MEAKNAYCTTKETPNKRLSRIKGLFGLFSSHDIPKFDDDELRVIPNVSLYVWFTAMPNLANYISMTCGIYC